MSVRRAGASAASHEPGDRRWSGKRSGPSSYLIEGRPSRDCARTKAMLLGEPELWAKLMDTVALVLIRYLRAQIDAGVDAAPRPRAGVLYHAAVIPRLAT